MASGKIQGITVTIGGDTSQLNNALKGTNKQIQGTQKDLKQVEKLLKLDPTNTKLLEQRQRLLGDAVQATSEKLKTLKTAESQAQEQFAKGEISQQAYDALQREIVQTEQSLKSLEKQASTSNAKIAEVSAGAEKLAAGASKVQQATKTMSTVAAGGVVAIGGLAVKTGQYADELNTLSNQSGFSTEEIQKWQYASDLVDVSTDDIISAATKMKNNMDSTSSSVTGAFSKLGVSVTDAEGNMRDSTDVFYEVIAALSKVGNETERDQLAMDIFGRGADNLAGIIDDGGAALKAYGDEAKRSGLILSQDALDSANQFNDGLDLLKAKATAAFMESGASLTENLLPVLDKLVEVGSSVLEWISNIDGKTLTTIATVLAVVAAISPLAGLIAGISTAISTLSTVISFITANPITLLIAAIVGLIALVVANWDTITGWAKNVWGGITETFTAIVSYFQNDFLGQWNAVWSAVGDFFVGVWEGLVNAVKSPINAIIGYINTLIDAINSMIGGINNVKFDVPSWIPGLGGRSIGFNIATIGNIPQLATGGTVLSGSAIVGESGAELLTVGANGTRVTPLGGGSHGGAAVNIQSITFNGYTSAQGRELVKDLNRQLGRLYV